MTLYKMLPRKETRMKCNIILNSDHEEGIWIYAREKTDLIEQIERLVDEDVEKIAGYQNGSFCYLTAEDIYCVTVENGKVFALTESERWLLKLRLYQLEGLLGDGFIKINQSCLVNVKKIRRFDASFSASLTVTLKNGYRDYVSRRQMRAVKERMGFYS